MVLLDINSILTWSNECLALSGAAHLGSAQSRNPFKRMVVSSFSWLVVTNSLPETFGDLNLNICYMMVLGKEVLHRLQPKFLSGGSEWLLLWKMTHFTSTLTICSLWASAYSLFLIVSVGITIELSPQKLGLNALPIDLVSPPGKVHTIIFTWKEHTDLDFFYLVSFGSSVHLQNLDPCFSITKWHQVTTRLHHRCCCMYLRKDASGTGSCQSKMDNLWMTN